MTMINPLAEALNRDLSMDNSSVYSMLSRRGRSIYFPAKGILGQSAEAKNTAINATIGTAFEEDGSPLTLECMENLLNLPSESFLYMPSFGAPKLREEWQRLLLSKNPSLRGKAFSQPVVTAALTHGLSIAGYLFVDEGDQMILPDLYWDNYELVFQETYGAKLVFHNTFINGGYDIQALSRALSGPIGKKIVLLNFPNNPTGYTVTEQESDALAAVIKQAAEAGNHVVVFLDDAYFGLVYEEGVARESMFARLADLHPNVLAVKMDGPTKEDYVWGFRVGFISFAFRDATPSQLKALENKAAGAVRATISNAPSISQSILLKGYVDRAYEAQKNEKYAVLHKRYLKIREIFRNHPEYKASFEAMPFNSGYFMCVRPIGADPEAVRKVLIESYNTGVIVLSGLIRVAFSAVPYDKLEALFANIHHAIQRVRS